MIPSLVFWMWFGVNTRSFPLYRATLCTKTQGGIWVLTVCPREEENTASELRNACFRESRTCALCYLVPLPWALGETSFLLFHLVLTLAFLSFWNLILNLPNWPPSLYRNRDERRGWCPEGEREEGREGDRQAVWEDGSMVQASALKMRGPEFTSP